MDMASKGFRQRVGKTEASPISACRSAPISTIQSLKDRGKVEFVERHMDRKGRLIQSELNPASALLP